MTHLSAPILYHAEDIKANSALTTQIRLLINDAFQRSKTNDTEKWTQDKSRFPTNESYYDMLATNTIVAVIFDQDACAKATEDSLVNTREQPPVRKHKVIACAAAVPWKGGWAREGAGKEHGWEIKAIAVDGDTRYLRKGLAVQIMDCLEKQLIENAKKKQSTGVDVGVSKESGKRCLTLWILAAECLNGPYWKRRGFREARRSTEGEGVWGCKTRFELVVYRKEVEYSILD
ncbi:hypothetical protein GQ44DRAFT_763041 [Phaeosphaeriaceae sp. PMI808]|nr:hypothetical protein GQ44DRAFT_763041 [Phaeosphaeriaceae sp. PMI808]